MPSRLWMQVCSLLAALRRQARACTPAEPAPLLPPADTHVKCADGEIKVIVQGSVANFTATQWKHTAAVFWVGVPPHLCPGLELTPGAHLCEFDVQRLVVLVGVNEV